MSTARVIKKYPNRRLYDTEESRYITLADVRDLVLKKTAFVVIDKKTGQDITRSILLHVIIEQEQHGEAVMSEDFLSQVIRSYGKVLPVFRRFGGLRDTSASEEDSMPDDRKKTG